MKKNFLDELSNHYNAAKRLHIMLVGTMMYLLLMCIITKIAMKETHCQFFQ